MRVSSRQRASCPKIEKRCWRRQERRSRGGQWSFAQQDRRSADEQRSCREMDCSFREEDRSFREEDCSFCEKDCSFCEKDCSFCEEESSIRDEKYSFCEMKRSCRELGGCSYANAGFRPDGGLLGLAQKPRRRRARCVARLRRLSAAKIKGLGGFFCRELNHAGSACFFVFQDTLKL
jgi:hypothetical protein